MGKLSEPPSMELDHRLRDYGLQTTGWNESLQAFDAVTKVLPPHLASCLIAFALLPVLQHFFPTTATRPAVLSTQKRVRGGRVRLWQLPANLWAVTLETLYDIEGLFF